MVTAAKKTAASAVNNEIQILELHTGEMEFCILGTSPLICNRMAQKAWFELLAPKGKKSTAERAANLKHDPVQEFRNSPYMLDADEFPNAAIGMMAGGFKAGMGVAALRIPGIKKTEIEQLVRVRAQFVEIFGLPQIFMAITRSADMNKTPDVRTRAIIPEWACRVKLEFVKPNLREQGVANLLAAAGIVSGLGDWRQEKGSGSFGAYKLVDPDEADFKRLTKTQGRKAQLEALNDPHPYNEETSEMLSWFDVEMKRRGFKVAA